MTSIRAELIVVSLLMLATAIVFLVLSDGRETRQMEKSEEAARVLVPARDTPVRFAPGPAAPHRPSIESFEVLGFVAAPNTAGMALISIHGAPASMFRVGDKIDNNHVLAAITPQGVTIRSTDGMDQLSSQLSTRQELSAESDFKSRGIDGQPAIPAIAFGGAVQGRKPSTPIMPTQQLETPTAGQGQIGDQLETSPSGLKETSGEGRGPERPGVALPSVPQ